MNSNLFVCFKILILIVLLFTFYYTLHKYKDETTPAKILFFTKNLALKSVNNPTIKKTNQLNPNSYVPLPNKYVVFQCTGKLCGGWGDRIDGIMGAMALALIQNRTFLIRITQPCLINQAFKSNIIKWDQSININISLTEHYIKAMNNFEKGKDLSTLDWTSHLSNINIIKIKSNLDWLIALSSNIKLKDRIKQLGYEPEKFRTHFLLHEWYSKLFNLSTELENKYKNFLKQAKPTSSETKLICVQIRIGGDKRKNRHSDKKFNSLNITKMIWNELESKILSKINNKNYKIFITTDDDRVEEEAFKHFGKNKVITNKGEILHIDLDVGNLFDCTRIEKTLLDFHSLQNCDVAVTTSGFGKIGAWNRKDPFENLYVVYKGHLLRTNN